MDVYKAMEDAFYNEATYRLFDAMVLAAETRIKQTNDTEMLEFWRKTHKDLLRIHHRSTFMQDKRRRR